MYYNDINYNCDNKHPQYLKWRQRSLMMKFLNRIKINEWTFSLFLFIISSTIVVVKLLFIYGVDIPSTFGNNLSSFSNIKSHFYDVYVLPNGLNIEKTDNNYRYLNETTFYSKQIDNYQKVVTQTTIRISNEYGWFIKAILSGLGILSVTWFIVYKDSNIPGINPPLPFNPSRKKLTDNSIIQMNYLIGIINGILIFIYMSLQ